MTMMDFALNFLYSFFATVIGGGLLAFLFFWLREKIFPLPNISGWWYFETHTVNSAYNPFKGMILRYVVILWREGNLIKGTVEKIYEKSSTGERDYEEKNRTRGIIEGSVAKNYFSKDRVMLHVIEEGHGRESTHFYDLLVNSDSEMVGSFNSMIANQDGKTRWQRDNF